VCSTGRIGMGTDGDLMGVARIDTLTELEISAHHTVNQNSIHNQVEYEIHAGGADIIEIPRSLAQEAKEVVGVDLETEYVQCGATIEIIEADDD